MLNLLRKMVKKTMMKVNLARRWRLYPNAVPILEFSRYGETYRIWLERTRHAGSYIHVGELIISDKLPFELALLEASKYIQRALGKKIRVPEVPMDIAVAPVGQNLKVFSRILWEIWDNAAYGRR